MAQVQTKNGLEERASLDLMPTLTENDNEVSVVLEWRSKLTGEVVRRDGWVSLHRGLASGVVGSLGGNGGG